MKNLENKRVVFLSLSGIGNLMMQLPTIEALKQAHPAWHITVSVAPRGTKEIANSQPYIDEVIEMPISVSIIGHIKNILLLRQKHFDIGIVLSPGQLLKSALYLRIANIPVRISSSYPYKQNPQSNKFLTHAIPEHEYLHDIEQNLRLLQPLGITTPATSFYRLHIPQNNIQQANEASEANAAISYIGFHAGCAKGFEFKQWPIEYFAEVAKGLIQKYPNIKILVFGGPDEEAQKQELVRMINTPPLTKGRLGGVLVDQTPSNSPLIRGRTISATLLTTAAIMQHCKFFLSNDSGLMHLAASVGTPVLGIFGPTDERQTGPRGGLNNYVVRAPGTTPVYNTEKNQDLGNSPHLTLLALTPQMVLDKIEQINTL